MEKSIVDYYVWNILKKQLQRFKISNLALYDILDDVKLHLNSIISNWNDKEFRDAILIVGSEEGSFYEPNNDLISDMVVVAIRNTLLEGVCSDFYKDYGSKNAIDDKYVKTITSEAIIYFSKFNLNDISSSIGVEYDFYRDISNKYPRAFNALKELSKCSKSALEHAYHFECLNKKYELEEFKVKSSVGDVSEKNVESGIDPFINSYLLNYLLQIKNTEYKLFVTDCFKMVTRNYEKLLRILEFILTYDGVFITCNYLISSNYVSRREDLLKASHTTEEYNRKIKFLPSVTQNEKYIIDINKFLEARNKAY